VRTRPYSQRAVVGIALLGVGLLAVVLVVPGTLARLLDAEQGLPGTAASATVVLGGRSTPPTLTFASVRSGTPRTVNLTIDYRGSVPATVQLRLPSGATTTSCVGSGSTWTDGTLVGTLTLTLGAQSAVSYCSLLDGAARTLITTVQPGTVTTVPIVATVGGLALLSRTEKAAIVLRAVGRFTDQVAGTITISSGGVLAMSAAARAAPTPTTTAAAAAPATPPSACAAAGLKSFAETVTLTADRPTTACTAALDVTTTPMVAPTTAVPTAAAPDGLAADPTTATMAPAAPTSAPAPTTTATEAGPDPTASGAGVTTTPPPPAAP
jgi:hypothetical protein